MKVWLVMHWDYEQTGPMGIYDSIEAVFEAYPNELGRWSRIWKQHDDTTWIQDDGYEAELVEVETLESVMKSKRVNRG